MRESRSPAPAARGPSEDVSAGEEPAGRGVFAWAPAARTPAVRLLVLALGLLGLVAGPAAAGAPGEVAATGAVSGVRTGPAPNTSARTRTVAKPRTGGQARAVIAAIAASAAGPGASDAQTAHAALPASGTDARPPSGRAAAPAAAPASPDIAPRDVPRGRAPPAAARI